MILLIEINVIYLEKFLNFQIYFKNEYKVFDYVLLFSTNFMILRIYTY
jgi:hypothetical protein